MSCDHIARAPVRALEGLGEGLRWTQGLPSGASGKEPACQCRRHKRYRFDSWVRKVHWRRAWQPIPVFLPRESHGQRSLAGYGPWGHKESDLTEVDLAAAVAGLLLASSKQASVGICMAAVKDCVFSFLVEGIYQTCDKIPALLLARP